MTLISALAMVFGIASGFANIPQWIKIFKRKSANDISIITYSLLFAGAVAWIFYGFELREFPIIITNIVGAINIGLVIIGYFFYGRTS